MSFDNRCRHRATRPAGLPSDQQIRILVEGHDCMSRVRYNPTDDPVTLRILTCLNILGTRYGGCILIAACASHAFYLLPTI